MGELRAPARKPAPAAAGDADGRRLRPARREPSSAAGDPIAAARAFERGREAWAAIVARQASRGITGAAAGGSASRPRRSRRAPTTREPRASRSGARAGAVRRVTCRRQAMTPEQEFERANIMRLLQSFKRAFDSRSGDRCARSGRRCRRARRRTTRREWQRALSQQWTYNSVHIRMAARRQARQRRHRGHGDVAHARRPREQRRAPARRRSRSNASARSGSCRASAASRSDESDRRSAAVDAVIRRAARPQSHVTAASSPAGPSPRPRAGRWRSSTSPARRRSASAQALDHRAEPRPARHAHVGRRWPAGRTAAPAR